ncbi:MAG: hypothetical protein FWF83_05105 [Clostridiales bacterium]|nr:hypothetical protein [Clostridiales bacterium]
MTAEVWETAASIYADLRRNHFAVGDADILIAAFCIENAYTLVTGNTRDFKNINGLQTEDWV